MAPKNVDKPWAGNRPVRSRTPVTSWIRHVVAVAGIAASMTALAMALPASAPAAAIGATVHRPPTGSFNWLVPHPPPPTWHRASTPSGRAVLAYPTSFSRIAGDTGSVSAGLTNSAGHLLAYVNVTPRQGTEQLKGFGHFRVNLIGKDDDKDVHLRATAEGLPFRSATGSCVVDDYRTRLGDNHYREIACLVVGNHGGGSVVVAAAAEMDWLRFRSELRQVVASFKVA